METVLRDNSALVLRFDRGEDVLDELKRFCGREGIQAASFTALGAAQDVELAWYNITEKRYGTSTLTELLEIAHLTGNVSLDGDKVHLHAHGVFGSADGRTYAGHVNRVVVAATCELVLNIFTRPLRRQYSEDIGLKLLVRE